MTEPPKLFTHKPKKGQIKEYKGNVAKSFSPMPKPVLPSRSTSASPSAPVKESFFRRYKYLWPVLLVVNVTYGAYTYARFKNHNTSAPDEAAASVAVPSADPVSSLSPPSEENTPPSAAITTLPASIPVTETILKK